MYVRVVFLNSIFPLYIAYITMNRSCSCALSGFGPMCMPLLKSLTTTQTQTLMLIGHVHSVFRWAVNIKIAKETEAVPFNCTLLLKGKRSRVPFGLEIVDDKLQDGFRDISRGDPCFWNPDSWDLECGASLKIQIPEIRDDGCWNASVPKKPENEKEDDRWNLLVTECRRYCCSSCGGERGNDHRGFLPLLRWLIGDSSNNEMMMTPICKRAQFVLNRTGDLGSLVGLGDGLTPSGDDFLIGLSAAQQWAQPEAESSIKHLDLMRTTDVSRVFYKAASLGYYSERVLNLFHSDAEVAKLAVKQLLLEDDGSTSGADLLLGVLWNSPSREQ